MEFTIQNYACALCGKDDTGTLLKKQGFSIVQCGHCGFVYVNPRVQDEQLSTIYQHNYFTNKDYGYADYEQEKRLRVKNFERWLKDAEPFIGAGKTPAALDVGSAAGYCLGVMKAKGWQAQGLELDKGMCAQTTAEGFRVSNTELAEFTTDEKFDVITLFDVIEHIPALDKAFSKLADLLQQDGVVVMVTPNHGSFQRKLFRKRWFQYKPIEHIHYFTKDTIGVFAARHGFRICCHTHSGQYADAQFITNRLKYYQFPFLAGFFSKLFSVTGTRNKCLYLGTGSLFLVLKKA